MSEETNGKIRVYHWWPGRQYAGESPIHPALLANCERRGTRYLTLAFCDGYFGLARCCPKDNPSRRLGREIALGRLRANMEQNDAR
ncbi:MAG: hypothetical protein EHM35_00355 [Planctomycetaceae bacterium]|nr:MAG: hypothetical protein EHM35_00355 [Planctomycetaceae bacterium]